MDYLLLATLPLAGGDEGEGGPNQDQHALVHPHPRPPPSKGGGDYWENFKNVWLDIVLSEGSPFRFSCSDSGLDYVIETLKEARTISFFEGAWTARHIPHIAEISH